MTRTSRLTTPPVAYHPQTGGPNLSYGGRFTAINEPTAYSNIAFGGGWRPGVPEAGNLSSITNGYDNTAIGAGVLVSATTAHASTAVGADALSAVTTGHNNTAIGAQSAETLTTGHDNTALGAGSLQYATTGQYNSAIGELALNTLVDGTYNVAVGYEAAWQSVSGDHLIAMGYQSLGTTPGDFSIGIGGYALTGSTEGPNVAVGHLALASLGAGADNTAIGYLAGYSFTASYYNTVVGHSAGYTDGTTTTAAGIHRCTLLGYNAQATASNSFVLGSALSGERTNLYFGVAGTAAAVGGGVGVFAIAPAATNPGSTPTGAGVLYVDSSTNALKYKGPSGTVTTLAVA